MSVAEENQEPIIEEQEPPQEEAVAAPVEAPPEPKTVVREEAAFHGQAPRIQERRANPRYLAHWRAALVDPADGNVRYLGKTDNISICGAAIISDTNVPPRQEYHVYLEIPQVSGKAPLILELIGKVVYCNLANNAFRVGVTFKQYHGDAEKVLRSIVSSGKLKQLSDPG
ncbi:MAG: PilZ domain-containing protein [Hydrogenophilaceae bacterium]|nr:PilZ domain-containing protein [Hydrogenophilaceae bacterium]